jgi:preflagellin peptidase FlaK
VNSIPDLLRLVAVPAFAWIAWRDVTTRRVSDRAWVPLLVVGVLALLWDLLLIETGAMRRLLLVRVGLSVSLLVPLSYVFWRLGGFGGADAKAFMVLSLLSPAYPAYEFLGTTLPRVETALGVFSITIVTNTVLIGLFYPVSLAVRNALAGEFSLRGFIARPMPAGDATARYGRLLDGGSTRGGLDLDALRMYLRWRGLTLEELRHDRSTYRDPESVPESGNPPGDGAIPGDAATSGSAAADGGVPAGATFTAERRDALETETARTAGSGSEGNSKDPWGAAAFLADIDSTAYGTAPEDLREGLDALSAEETVWITPGIPFLVPLFVGLCLALVYGDLLFFGLRALGVLP